MSEPPVIPDPPDSDNIGLFYRASNGYDFINLAIPPETAITDPRERDMCRTLLVRALALLDAAPPRPDEEPTA